MHSRIASEVERQRRERLAAMTPGERVALGMRLGEAGLASYMTAHGVDRRTAASRIKATRRLGRRHSVCAETA